MNKANKLSVVTFLITIFFCSVNTFAETIILKSGEKVSGNIIEGNQEYIKIIVDGKSRTVPINEIDRIEDPNEKIPLPMFGNIPKTARQKEIDEKFINAELKETGSTEAAAKGGGR